MKVRRHARTGSKGFGGRVDAHENDFRLPDTGLDIRAEKQVPATGNADHVVHSRFIDGQVVRVPPGNPFRVDVHSYNFV